MEHPMSSAISWRPATAPLSIHTDRVKLHRKFALGVRDSRRSRAAQPEAPEAAGHDATFDPHANVLAEGNSRLFLDYVLVSHNHRQPSASDTPRVHVPGV